MKKKKKKNIYIYLYFYIPINLFFFFFYFYKNFFLFTILINYHNFIITNYYNKNFLNHQLIFILSLHHFKIVYHTN